MLRRTPPAVAEALPETDTAADPASQADLATQATTLAGARPPGGLPRRAWLQAAGVQAGLMAAATWASPAARAAQALAAGATPSPIQTGQWVHALSQFGSPKYPADYPHRDYVDPAAPKGGLLRLSNADRRSSFDKLHPFSIKGVAQDSFMMFMYDPLCEFSMDEPMSLYGVLAEAMLVAPDLSSLTLRLRPQARFNNGDPVLAADVADSLARLQGPQIEPRYGSPLQGVAAAVVVDERTVRFDMKERSVDAIFGAATMPVFSRRWGDGKPLHELTQVMPITSGPYTLDQHERPSKLEYKRNPQYWARDLPVRRGFFNFDRIRYRLYNDIAVRREAFKAGDFHILRELSSNAYMRIHTGPKWRDGRIVRASQDNDLGQMLQSMHYNLRRPKWQDIRVREALMRAWDFEALDRWGMFTRSNSLFSNSPFAAQGSPGAAELALLEPFREQLPAAVFGPAFQAPRNNTGPNALRENLLVAARLLTEAGWAIGSDGQRRNAQGEVLSLELLTPARPGAYPAFTANLKKLGVLYTERQVDFALYSRRIDAHEFDMIVIVEGKFTLPDASTLRRNYHSSQADPEGADNYRGVKSPAVDALIEHIANARSLERLKTAAHALDRVVMWNHWQIPQLYKAAENLSYWNRFGMPKVQARYFQIDSLPDTHSMPWPLWTWWDLASDPRASRRSGT